MGFLDSIKDRLRGGGDEYYEDDYYDDGGYEDDSYAGDASARRDASSSLHVLGTTPRPEAESVSVYTRSGRPVGGREQGAPSRRSSEITQVMPEVGSPQPQQQSAYDQGLPSYQAPEAPARSSQRAQQQRVTSGQLPPYVLRPVSYEDVQTVVRRVRTNQPVVVVFRDTNIETAKRILDFCFGFSYGVDGEVQELGDRVFAVLPKGVSLTATDIDKLVADGDLVR